MIQPEEEVDDVLNDQESHSDDDVTLPDFVTEDLEVEDEKVTEDEGSPDQLPWEQDPVEDEQEDHTVDPSDETDLPPFIDNNNEEEENEPSIPDFVEEPVDVTPLPDEDFLPSSNTT